jgi:hypothetical protein
MPVALATWEAEAGGSWFKASCGSKPCVAMGPMKWQRERQSRIKPGSQEETSTQIKLHKCLQGI